MDLKKFIEEQSLMNFPVGLGGCRATNSFFDSCDYDITIFDNRSENEKIIIYDDSFVKIHHGSLNETKEYLLKNVRSNDIVIVMSAGDADTLSGELLKEL